MARALFETALQAAQALHNSTPETAAFVDWDPAPKWAGLSPSLQPAAHMLATEARFAGGSSLPEHAALTAPGPHASWLRTYTDDQIAPGFNARFGSYALLGPLGHFRSERLAAYVLYSDAGLWYPWHEHPAEELYLIVAGCAEFAVDGQPGRTFRPGDICIHRAGQPHAMQTKGSPVLALVLWRGDLFSRPKLTPGF